MFLASVLDFEPLKEWDILKQFLFLLFTKMGQHNVPPKYRIEKCFQLLDTCFVMVD